ncbi:MAG: aspartate kinase [Myxococcota bacterium]|nr:aspartate kinase [Myxococcota bacterium]
MGIIVQKYGGSSLADVEKIGLVADKIVATRRAGHDVVVVVSAMGKTTDQLLGLARQIDESPPRRELDMLLTTGERVSMALMSIAIHKRGLEAISFTGSQVGILTNDRHFDARIIEVRPVRVEDELARGKIVIVAGYQGMSYRREITTLGRGGSDTTALALAAALGAERAEIYSDVDGVYTADPRVVPDARHIPEIGYEAMQEMAEAGAKVLHAAAVEFARRARIAIHARATFRPGRETIVHDLGRDGRAPVCAVGQRNLARVEVAGDPTALRRALAEAEDCQLVARDVEHDGRQGAFHVVLAQTPDWNAARARLVRALGDAVRIEEGLGTASVVGDASGPERIERALAAVERAGARPLRVSSSALRLAVLLRDEEVDATVRALHEAFVADAPDPRQAPPDAM